MIIQDNTHVVVSVPTIHALEMEIVFWKKDVLRLTGNPKVSKRINYPYFSLYTMAEKNKDHKKR